VSQAWAVLLASLVTAVGGVIVALLSKVKKENKQDHQYVSAMLTLVYKSVSRNENKLDKLSGEVDSLRGEVRTHTH
jgi:hypothetical protein